MRGAHSRNSHSRFTSGCTSPTEHHIDPTCGRLVVKAQWVHNPKPKEEWGHADNENARISPLDKVCAAI
jgi:hypothetical protein